MKKMKNCKHCCEPFEARRSNHVYCTTSCKTKASYLRNDYKYVSGHYEKQKVETVEAEQIIVLDTLSAQIQSLEEKITALQENNKPTVNGVEIANAALGAAAANTAMNGLKKVFAPHTLPATKEDITILKNVLMDLKNILYQKSVTKFTFGQ